MPGMAVMAGCPHWPAPLPFPGGKLFRGPTTICWKSQGSWKSPSHKLREATPHSLSGCHLGPAGRAGFANMCPPPPKGMDGVAQSSFSSDSQISSVSHHAAGPRTQEPGTPDSWTECAGALPAGQAGQQWGHSPDTAQTLRGEEGPRPASSRNSLSLHGGRSQISLFGPGPPLFPPLSSLRFFL